MRKILSLFLLFAFVFSCCAEELYPYDISANIRYGCMTTRQEEFYDILYEAVKRGDTRVEVPPQVTAQEAQGMLIALYLDAPELCRYNCNASTVKYVDNDGIKSAVSCVIEYYDISFEQQQAFIDEVRAASSAFSGLPAAEAFDGITEFLCDKLTYGIVDGGKEYSAYHAWYTGIGVCEAYSRLFTLMCHFAGYPSAVIAGITYDPTTGEALSTHSWNIVKADKIYTLYDPTWNDSSSGLRMWSGLGSSRMNTFRTPFSDWYSDILPTCAELNKLRRIVNEEQLLDAIADKPESVTLWLSDKMYASDPVSALARAGMDWKTGSGSAEIRTLMFSGCTYSFVPDTKAVNSLSELNRQLELCAQEQADSIRICFTPLMYRLLPDTAFLTSAAAYGISGTLVYSDKYHFYGINGCTYR